MFFSFFRIFDVPYASFKIHSPPLNNPYMPPLWSLCEVVLCSPVGANPERRQTSCVFLKSLDRFLLVKLICLSGQWWAHTTLLLCLRS